jgi:predicted regulator of Ras-like GTPase activity (Roadblock/LC7/MglB family)
MNIPFLDLFEKLKERFVPAQRVSSPPPLPVPVNKPESDKLAKTVVPNAVRTIGPGESAASEEQPSGSRSRMVAVGATPKRSRDLPPAVALALEPRVERVLSLVLSDVIDQMPEGYLKPRESFDTTRRVLLKAADVEKGMATGRPKMAVATLYQQMPEIFMHSVPASDATAVDLPFNKVIEELSNLRVRHDQTEEQVVTQYQTPFLQVTVEESERFGTKMEPVEVTEFPRMRMGMAPATAEAIAAAEPEPTAQEKFTPSHVGLGIQSRQARQEELPAEPPISVPQKEDTPALEADAATRENQATARIPFSLHPTASEKSPSPSTVEQASKETLSNGTGEPAFPRVPASGGPPVPPLTAPAPTRIPFKLTPLSEPKPEPALPVAGPLETSKVSVPASPTKVPESNEPMVPELSDPMVTLSLRPILESLPPMQIAGDVSSVPAETKISFRFALIAPQLATGKVVVQPKDFQAALPPAHRDLFLPDAVEAPVQLSLPEVLAHLPGNALQMRADQEVVTQDEIFETPFSTKAAEDAKRFGSGAAQDVAPAAAAQKQTAEQPADESKAKGGPTQIAKPELLKIEKSPIAGPMPTEASAVAAAPRFDARDAVAKASALPGVGSCSLIFADGLSIAGNIPGEMHIEGLSAVAPTLLKRLEKHMLETQLGALTCLTVHGEKSPVTFFASGNICLTAVHSVEELSAATRRELGTITQELSRTYAQPGTAHVDH